MRQSYREKDDAEHIGLKSDGSSTSENAMGILLYSTEPCRAARLALQMIEEGSKSSELLYTALNPIVSLKFAQDEPTAYPSEAVIERLLVSWTRKMLVQGRQSPKVSVAHVALVVPPIVAGFTGDVVAILLVVPGELLVGNGASGIHGIDFLENELAIEV